MGKATASKHTVLFSIACAFFCRNKFVWVLATQVKMLSLADWGSSRLRQNIVPPSPQSAYGPLFKNNERIKHAVFNNVYHTLLIRNTSTKMRPKLHLHHSRTRKPRKPIKLGKMRTVYPLPPSPRPVLCWRPGVLRSSTVYKGKKKAKVTKQIIYLGW